MVRTTVTLDADTEALLRRRMRERGLSFKQALNDAIRAFAWTVLLAFIRLSTKIALFPNPLPVRDSLDRVAQWTAQPASVIVEPTPRHLQLVAGLLTTVGSGGNLVSDAHLAALALEHDAVVVSYDTDFDRFAGVRRRQTVAS
jgi:hypothetical protein